MSENQPESTPAPDQSSGDTHVTVQGDAVIGTGQSSTPAPVSEPSVNQPEGETESV